MEEKIPEVDTALKNLEMQEADLNNRIESLGKELVALGQKPENDPDYRQWCVRRDGIARERELLRKDLKSAYLTYKKFELSPDNTSRGEYEKSLQAGRQAAEQVHIRYEELRSQLAP